MPTNTVLGRLDQVMFKERLEQSRVLDLVNKLPTSYQRALSFICEKDACGQVMLWSDAERALSFPIQFPLEVASSALLNAMNIVLNDEVR